MGWFSIGPTRDKPDAQGAALPRVEAKTAKVVESAKNWSLGLDQQRTKAMKFHSLAHRVFLVTTLALVPALGILAANIFLLGETKTEELHTQALKSAELASLEIERILVGTESVLKVVASAPVVARHDGARCSEFLEKIVTALPFVFSLVIIDLDGTVWCMPGLNQPLNLGDRPYFVDALASQERVTGVFTTGKISGQNVLPLALRYEVAPGVVGGVVAGYISLDWLQTTIENRSYSPGSSLTIADRDGRILARTPAPEEFVGTVIPDAFQRLVNAPQPGTEELKSQDGTLRVIGYYPARSVPEGIYVSTGISSVEAFAPLRRLNTFAALISLVGAVSALFLAAYTSRVFIVQPFGRLIDTVGEWRAGRIDTRASISPNQGEIGLLGAALDGFMDELVEARAARRTAEDTALMLAAEMNHRTKNLLAMVQAVARQSYAHVDAADATTTFSGRLKAIAAANTVLVSGQWQGAMIEQIIEGSIAPFRDPQADDFALIGPSLEVSSDAALALGMALHELCTNASKYGAPSTEAGRVSITWGIDEDLFSLVWAEHNGPPVAAPSRTGFGSRVIKDVLEQKIGGIVKMVFAAEGLICTVKAPLEALLPREADTDARTDSSNQGRLADA